MDKKAFRGWQRQAIRDFLAAVEIPLLTTKQIIEMLGKNHKPHESPYRPLDGVAMTGWFSKLVVGMTIRMPKWFVGWVSGVTLQVTT